jgi:hypothetical protein
MNRRYGYVVLAAEGYCRKAVTVRDQIPVGLRYALVEGVPIIVTGRRL